MGYLEKAFGTWDELCIWPLTVGNIWCVCLIYNIISSKHCSCDNSFFLVIVSNSCVIVCDFCNFRAGRGCIWVVPPDPEV